MIKQKQIELLAPAKNAACGIEALKHGADAVYIGASRFGARAAAGNSIQDIEELINFAHLYNARVYVAVNTILYDNELEEVEKLIWQLYRIGADALIVQDLAVLKLNLPPISLHASTQMDNRTPSKVALLKQMGFEQVVLARELSLDDIAHIHRHTDVALEAFVHGALCVSYSGQCYVSQHCFGRSANRGECAQFCRLAFDLVDSKDRTIARNKHFLSLKDMNRSAALEQLIDAGVSSLKIEGRLKDISYVKNITAYYRKALDAIIKRRPEYCKASSGTVNYTFTPQSEKSFNRGFTDYFLKNRTADIISFNTPKSLGEEVGVVKEIRGRCIIVSGVKSFSNGDGLCYLDGEGKLQGFRVNRVENNKIYPLEMPQIIPHTRLYRNYDQDFERLLSRDSAERKVGVNWKVTETDFGFSLTLTDEDGVSVTAAYEAAKEPARTSQQENQKQQLSKLGDTPFEVHTIEIDFASNWFLPSSVLSAWRRELTEKLLSARRINYPIGVRRPVVKKEIKIEEVRLPELSELTYLANVANKKADEMYRQLGAFRVDPAYEIAPKSGQPLMFCKHCLRFSMGWCVKNGGNSSPFTEPYFLVSSDGRRFRLEFDCKVCQMNVYAHE